MKRFIFLAGCLFLIAGCEEAPQHAAKAPPPPTPSQPIVEQHTVVDPANSGVNVRDRREATKTPIDQNENQADINVTADIRKKVVATDMSVNAKNVKIITQDGKVTLRGPVATAEEKQQVEALATEVAGAGNVDSQLEVQP